MLDSAIVDKLVTHWYDGWNKQDIDIVMAPFAENVVFGSAGVAKMSGESGRDTIEGLDAVRAYMADSLQRTVGVTYTHDATYVGTDGVVIVWTCYFPGGSTLSGADNMRVDPSGQVYDWRSYYADELTLPENASD